MKHWSERSTPGEIEVAPWINPGAAQFFERLLKPEWRVLEHGSGGSTLWLAERVREVVSVESDADFYRSLLPRMPKNVKMMLWDKALLPKKIRGPFDLMFIDGEPVENRSFYLLAARQLVKPGGWVVLDNCNRPEYAEERKVVLGQAREFRVFHAGEGRYLYTEFFHLKGKE